MKQNIDYYIKYAYNDEVTIILSQSDEIKKPYVKEIEILSMGSRFETNIENEFLKKFILLYKKGYYFFDKKDVQYFLNKTAEKYPELLL